MIAHLAVADPLHRARAALDLLKLEGRDEGERAEATAVEAREGRHGEAAGEGRLAAVAAQAVLGDVEREGRRAAAEVRAVGERAEEGIGAAGGAAVLEAADRVHLHRHAIEDLRVSLPLDRSCCHDACVRFCETTARTQASVSEARGARVAPTREWWRRSVNGASAARARGATARIS